MINFFDNEIDNLKYEEKLKKPTVYLHGVTDDFLRCSPKTNRKIFQLVY